MKFLKKGLAVLFACTFVSVPLYHPVKADAVSMDDMRLFVDTRRGNSASFKNVLQGFFWHLLVIKVPAGTAFFCKF